MAPAFFWFLVYAQLIVTRLLLSAIAIALGLWLGTNLGLGAPLLQSWLAKEPGSASRLRRSLVLGMVGGLVLGAVLTLAVLLFRPLLGLGRPGTFPHVWQAVLASIGAGINEELWFRLGFMTVLFWAGTKLFRLQRAHEAVMWTSMILAALIFGAAHLPQLAALSGLSVSRVAYVLFVNSAGGVVCGWLYWRHGLLAAMAAHLTADLVLHVIRPILQ
jgi:membrane protease YdiL (CAAX protease family)